MKVELDVIKAICDKEIIHLFFLSDSQLKGFEQHGRHFGAAMCDGKRSAIFLREGLGKWETISIAAHEIAHVLLGHLMPDCNTPKELLEEEAKKFAAAFVALSVHGEHTGKPESGAADG